MGERTRALIGTPNGKATICVYSANPKTADGYNTFIFRREVEKSLRKLLWSPIVELNDRAVPSEAVRSDGKLIYTKQEKDAVRAIVVDMANGQKGSLTNDDFGAITITRSFVKEIQLHAIRSKVEVAAVSAAREIASTMVHVCGSPNEDNIRKNGVLFFEYGLQRVRLNSEVYLALGEVGIKVNSRPYYDQRIVAKFKANSEAPSLHGHLHIGESAFERIYDNRFRLILQGVEQYRLQTRDHAAWGRKNASLFLEKWLSDKKTVVLVTGRSSYEMSGAAKFLSPYLADRHVVHLTTVGENARTEDVEEKCRQLPDQIDAYIAVGGGTVIDTTKLLRGFSGVPFLAVPTTAGTGAEATRFAVYYDHGKKCSADDVRYLPTDRLLVPEFCESASAYQKAASAFDAYAQAVESLWAKGATDESKVFARRSLALMERGEQLLGSYWAGRAIDISRTTAAHAFSYYMTATYGIPHGHAVYMMFPFICKNNGHPEFIRHVDELQSLQEFANERGLDWNGLVDELFAHVNMKRLGNNPVEVRRESFYV